MQQSVKDKIKKIAKEKNLDYNVVQIHYIMEQFINNIYNSKYKDKFILKGGFLISHILKLENRTTSDIDFTLNNLEFSKDQIVQIFEEICSLKNEEKINFTYIEIKENQQDNQYSGFEVSISFGPHISEKFTIDLNCGDLVFPNEINYELEMLSGKKINIKSYNVETIIAEKLHTCLIKGDTNSRMRDYGDLYIFLKSDYYDNLKIGNIIEKKFKERNSTELLCDYNNIFNDVLQSENMNLYWKNYSRKNSFLKKIDFKQIVDELLQFLENIKSKSDNQ